jgi:hypothetical protein
LPNPACRSRRQTAPFRISRKETKAIKNGANVHIFFHFVCFGYPFLAFYPKKRSSTTDGHEYQAFAENQRFTRRVSETRCSKSVFIRVHPWFMTASFNSNCGIKVYGTAKSRVNRIWIFFPKAA